MIVSYKRHEEKLVKPKIKLYKNRAFLDALKATIIREHNEKISQKNNQSKCIS